MQSDSHVPAVDPDDKSMAEDEWRLPRARELAHMVFGEDLELAAGDTLDRHWLHVSSPLHCGKMRALGQLLQIWSASGHNKVRPHGPPLPIKAASLAVGSLGFPLWQSLIRITTASVPSIKCSAFRHMMAVFITFVKYRYCSSHTA
jgi:hypothetical protein